MAMPEGTTSSPSLTVSSVASSTPNSVKVHYDKDALLSFRKAPASVTRPDYLSHEFDTVDGLWDPDKWHKFRTNSTPPVRPSSRDEGIPKGPTRAKGDDEDNIVLGPQRRSFGLGCHVVQGTKEQAERGRLNGFSTVDSKDQRPLPLEAGNKEHIQRLEKRNDTRKTIGSGRLQQLSNYDQRGGDGPKVAGSHRADSEHSWRRDDSSPLFNRAAGDNTRHFNSGSKTARVEPEWFTADISQTDTIELHGFDVPDNANPTRAPNKKLKLSTDPSKAAKEKNVCGSVPDVKPAEDNQGHAKPDINEMPPREEASCAFDFNKFFEDFAVSSFQGEEVAEDITGTMLAPSSRESSRFSHWFGSTASETTVQPVLSSAVMQSQDSPPITTSVSHFFKQWDSQEKIHPVSKYACKTNQPQLGTSSEVVSEMTSHLKTLLFGSTKETRHGEGSELPAELIKLSNHMESRPLPSEKVHTVDEIESAIVLEKSMVSSLPTKSETGEMPAFQKLVNMLKNTGELSNDIPRMPDESVLKCGLNTEAMHVRLGTSGVPLFESENCSPCVPSSSPLPESHRHSLVDAWLRSSDYQEPSLMQALEHSPADSPLMFSTQPPGHVAMPAPIHPMQQQSVIMTCHKTGTPDDIVASSLPQSAVTQSRGAFIRPTRSFVGSEQTFNHGYDMSFAAPVKQQDEDRVSINPLMLAESGLRPCAAPLVPAGFTPTSVMRKQASSKVDMREKLRQDASHDTGTASSVGSPPQPSAATSYSTDNWHALVHSQQHQHLPGISNNSEVPVTIPGLAHQASLSSNYGHQPVNVHRDVGQHLNAEIASVTSNLVVHHHQPNYTSFLPPSLHSGNVQLQLHHVPSGGVPKIPAMYTVNTQLPVRRAILKSGAGIPQNGLSQNPPQQQMPLDQSRLLHNNADSSIIHFLNQQHLLQLQLQQQRANMGGVLTSPHSQPLFAHMASHSPSRQLPLQHTSDTAPVTAMPVLGYRSPVFNRHPPLPMQQAHGLPVLLNTRTEPPAMQNELDPLQKWFGSSILQQMPSMQPPQKLGCMLTVDDLEAV